MATIAHNHQQPDHEELQVKAERREDATHCDPLVGGQVTALRQEQDAEYEAALARDLMLAAAAKRQEEAAAEIEPEK